MGTYPGVGMHNRVVENRWQQTCWCIIVISTSIVTAWPSSKAPAQAQLSRALAWKKSKPSHQWMLKLGSAQLKAQATAWDESKGEGEGKEQHHNMGNHTCCDVVPWQWHHV